MAYTVGELAKLTGITVRTLHHYDEIGLVRPSERTSAGYRQYGDADVMRLQQVLVYRELGMPLDEISRVIDDTAPRINVLRRHRSVLAERRGQLDAMLASIDHAIRLEEGRRQMQPDDVKSLFDGFDASQYEDEARERWGNTEAYKESARRTKRYGKPEWEAIRREGDAIYARLAELMREGAPPDDARCRGVVEAHRAHIDRWFYPCSAQIQRGLAEMYVADPRFTANLDRLGTGFARYLHDAILAASA